MAAQSLERRRRAAVEEAPAGFSARMRIIIYFRDTTSSISPCINTVGTKVPFCTIP